MRTPSVLLTAALLAVVPAAPAAAAVVEPVPVPTTTPTAPPTTTPPTAPPTTTPPPVGPVLEPDRADSTCVLGEPGAFVHFRYRDAAAPVRVDALEVGASRVLGSVVVGPGSGSAGVQVDDLAPGAHLLELRGAGVTGSSTTAAATPVRCDDWRDRDDYVATSNGALGYVETTPVAVRGGIAWAAQNGALYQTHGGTHAVQGAIYARYRDLGGSTGVLGVPTSSEFGLPIPFFGFGTTFERGAVYWSPETGARAVVGDIARRYAELGAHDSPLRLPVTDEQPTPVRPGAYSHFQGGSVYWSQATGAHEVRGAIRAEWARLGWENSALGFPVSGEYASGEFRRSDFEGGYVLWSAATGATAHLTGA